MCIIGSICKTERTLSMKTVYDVRDYTFGQEMLKLRAAIGLTQERLADYLGVSGRAVRRWEAGVSYPKAEHLKSLIALAVQQQAFTAGHESEEIRVFWKVARPKMLLDEDWFCALLSQGSSPQDKDAHRTDPYPSAHPSPPLTSMPSVEDSTSSAVPTPSQPLESGTTGVPWFGVGDGSVQGNGSAQRNGSVQGAD